MHHICFDVNGPSEWRYSKANETYYRFDTNGNIYRHIKGKNIPNPNIIWQKRLDLARLSKSSENGLKLKPQEATYKLWEDWQKRRNNACKSQYDVIGN